MDANWLNVLIFLPLFGAAWIATLRGPRVGTAAKLVGLLVSFAALAVAIGLFAAFDRGDPGWQFRTRVDWIPSLGIHYHVALDGTTLLLVMLTAVMTCAALAGAWRYIDRREREFTALMLALESALLCLFAARDLVLFYVCWEAVLIPMIAIIAVWGSQRRVYAALYFALYTAAGSLLMLVALLAVYHVVRGPGGAAQSMDIRDVAAELARLRAAGRLSGASEMWLFGAFALALAIKVPLIPFHTWLPEAHVESPTPGSVMLAALLLKMGGYGFLYVAWPLFPVAARAAAPALGVLAAAGVVYGSLMALAQTDLKRLIAYSSVAHMGIAMLGAAAYFGSDSPAVRALGFAGCVYVMLAHGLVSGALFLLAGMLYERRHTREISEFGGLAQKTPRLAAFFVLFSLAAAALPLTANFVGEFTALLGAWAWRPVLAAVGGTGMVLGAGYMLWLVHRAFFGPIMNPRNKNIDDAGKREISILATLFAAVVFLGVFPGPVMNLLGGPADLVTLPAKQEPRPAISEGMPAFHPKIERQPLTADQPHPEARHGR
jgi:NADH-quinone oxidoreductase subunit M